MISEDHLTSSTSYLSQKQKQSCRNLDCGVCDDLFLKEFIAVVHLLELLSSNTGSLEYVYTKPAKTEKASFSLSFALQCKQKPHQG